MTYDCETPGHSGHFSAPDWGAAGRVHDWRNYISEDLEKIWHTFSEEQKRLIAINAEDQASREQWD